MAAKSEARPRGARTRLERVLSDRGFAVTAEIAPPGSTDPLEIRRIAATLRDAVDACNVTDCQRAMVRMSALAAAVLTVQEGVEPVLQMVLRDRNRIALQSDLLGAAALGIRNVLCLRGDPTHIGNEPEAPGVYDLSTEEFLSMCRDLRDRGALRGGDTVDPPPNLFIGASANPFAGSLEESFANLRGKVTAGADFIQTQAIYDVDRFEEWMRLVRKEWLHEHVHILAGVIPLRSAKMARFMAEKVPGVVIPRDILHRMSEAPDPKAEGLAIALRTIRALRGIEGVHGVHIMAVNWEEAVPALVRDAGLHRGVPRVEIG
jgi:methylenetetrahydrofolate reductase (NADPH)